MNFSSRKQVSRLWRSEQTHIFHPFPGKNPVRLFIEVTIHDSRRQVNPARFYYNGAWKFEAIRRAQRVYNSLPADIRGARIIEYGAAGVLYSGSFELGRYSRLRSYVLLSPSYERGPSSRRTQGAYYAAPETRIVKGSKTLLLLEPLPEGDTERKNLVNKAFRNYTRAVKGEL